MKLDAEEYKEPLKSEKQKKLPLQEAKRMKAFIDMQNAKNNLDK